MPSAELNTRLTLSDQLTGRLKKSEKGIRGFVTRSTKALFSLRGAFIGLGAFGVARFITSTADAADAIGKLSERLGESSEFISRFRFAGDQAGIAANNLDTALQRVNRRFGEIAQFGRGEALPALQALGEALGEDLIKRVEQGEKFSDLLPTIARGFSEIEDETKKLAIAFKLFDTEGVGLLQLLKGGEESIREKLAAAKRVFTDEDTQKAAAFKDEIGKIKDAFGSAKDQIVLEFLPALTDSLKVLLEMKKAADDLFDRISATRSAGGAGFLPALLGPSIPTPRPKQADGRQPAFPDFSHLDAERVSSRLTPSIGEPAGGPSTALTDNNEALAEQGELLIGIETGARDVRKAFSDMALARGAIVDISFALTDGITDNLFAIVDGAKSAKEAFSDMAKSILRDIARIIVQALIARAIGGLVGGVLGNVAGGVSAGPSVQRAHGGFIPPGKMSQVQLHGGKFGEAIVPLQSRFGSVAGGGGGGGTTIIYNISAIDVEDFDNKVLGAVGRRDGEVSSIVAARSRNSGPLRTSFGIA